MKIAIFTETYFPFISGVVTHIETLKNCLEAQGHKVLIVTTNPKFKHHVVKNDVLYCPSKPLKKIYGYGIANPVNLKRLEILRQFDPDIIHLHTEFSMGLFALFAAKRLKKPTVYTLHTMYDDYMFYVAPKRFEKAIKPAAHFFFRKVANHATEIIGPSPKVVEFLRRCGVNRHINIVPNTIDLSAFMPENQSQEAIDAAKKDLGITPEDTSLCFVGRLGREKSIDVLIDYFTAHSKGDKHMKLFIIGDGPEKDALNEQIKSLGMEEQIRLCGRIDHDNIPPYYHACDLFATASLSEMNSISMLEAMASGLYVLQRLDVYNKAQISEGENGKLFETKAEFGTELELEKSMSEQERKARRTAVTASTQRYGQKEFIQAVLNVYERALDRYKRQALKK